MKTAIQDARDRSSGAEAMREVLVRNPQGGAHALKGLVNGVEQPYDGKQEHDVVHGVARLGV